VVIVSSAVGLQLPASCAFGCVSLCDVEVVCGCLLERVEWRGLRPEGARR